MTSMGGGPGPGPSNQFDWQGPEKRLRGSGYVNKILQQICDSEGIPKKGLKAELQQRIVDRLKKHAAVGNLNSFNRLKRMIENPGSIARPDMTNSASPGAIMAPAPSYGSGLGGINGYRAYEPAVLEFKHSPFYTIQIQLGSTKECQVMQQHRHTIEIGLRMSENSTLFRVPTDKSLRVMIFCSAEPSGRQEVSFPHQSELKVNGGEIKANLRGLKNKPGSTRPVDITSALRLQNNIPNYENKIAMTYALTTKKYYLVVYLVKIVEVEQLVKKLESGKRITKETVVADMVNKSRDTDIVATASVLSLKCPLSTLRITLPCRGMACRHNQCFDGTSYLQLQEQGPTWLCPICNLSATFDMLVIDEYLGDILKKTSRSIDQVTVQPDGIWEVRKEPDQRGGPKGVASTSDDDDDLVEITKSGDSVILSTPRGFGQSSTPFREASAASSVPSRATASTNGKRPISAVIDLTSSGDEDEPEDRAPKRQFGGFSQPLPLPANSPFRPGFPMNGFPRQ